MRTFRVIILLTQKGKMSADASIAQTRKDYHRNYYIAHKELFLERARAQVRDPITERRAWQRKAAKRKLSADFKARDAARKRRDRARVKEVTPQAHQLLSQFHSEDACTNVLS